MAADDKVICPECDKETVKGEKCANCSFPLEGFSDYERWQGALDKKKQKKAEEDRKKKEAEETERKKREAATKPAVKKSVFRKLGGK